VQRRMKKKLVIIHSKGGHRTTIFEEIFFSCDNIGRKKCKKNKNEAEEREREKTKKKKDNTSSS
jgi:hypothetical protein